MRISRALLMVGLSTLLMCGARGLAQEFPQAGKEHEVLKQEVGTWDAAIKSYSGPGEPEVSKGVEVNRMMPGGLWLLGQFDAELGGMEFHGAGQTGYSIDRKKYVGTWVDSMSSDPILLEGTYDPATRSLTLVGDYRAPGGVVMKLKTVSVHKDENTREFTMSMQMQPGGDFQKMMEVTYTKRK